MNSTEIKKSQKNVSSQNNLSRYFVTPGKNFNLSLLVVLLLSFVGSCTGPDPVWYRGNLHTHTFWSDGDEFPEKVAAWYKDHGYDFLLHSDHNMILEGERWRSFQADHPALAAYMEEFGKDWVVTKPDTAKEGNLMVRLKTLEEYRDKYEVPGEFLLIMGNEISNPHAVHLLSLQQNKVIPSSLGTETEREGMIRGTIDNLAKYRSETGINTWPVLAHPNFRWALTAEMMLNNPDLRYFEVYNGHPQVNNTGDELRAGTEQMWDIVLAHRVADKKGELLYGMATDDAHNYHGGGAGPGKGWIMVNAKELSPEALLDAIDQGKFYASTGVKIKKFSFNGKKYSLEIEPQEGVTYITEFIGTRKGFDRTSTERKDANGNVIENTTRKYSDQIGEVFSSSESLKSNYTLNGDELYVRVRITASADHIDPNSGRVLGKQQAWLQPGVPE